MNNIVKSILIIVFIILIQLFVYDLFLKSIITAWGASSKEVSMPMAGDDKNYTITSTRAILINAPKSEVWQWLIQLGADRGGFYCYTFIEEALGYKTRHQDIIKPEFKELKAGDLIRGSIDETSSIISYNFRVLYVKPEETFVLVNWGTFLLETVNARQTRLVIRTQDRESSNPWIRTGQYIAVPLHFVMERRTLIGIKARAENIKLSPYKDMVWFISIVMSWVLICFLIFKGRGIRHSIIIPVVLSLLWLCTLLLCDPTPFYSISFLLIVSIVISYEKISSFLLRMLRGS